MSDKITVAQALRRIKKLKGDIAEHTERAKAAVSYSANKVPFFRFNDEIASLKTAQNELVDLQSRVAIANAKATVVVAGNTMTQAEGIRRLQEIKGDIVFLKALYLRNETVKNFERNYDEIIEKYIVNTSEETWVSDISERDRDVQVKLLQETYEALNNAIEERNHKVTV